MWIIENRTRYDRSRLHHPSDLTDEVWRFIGPLIPSARRSGSEHPVEARKARDGILCILSSDCLLRWEDGRTLNGVHDPLYAPCRDQTLRETSPTAAVIDGHSLEGAERKPRMRMATI